MSIKEAKANVGSLVMSRDAVSKMVDGPWILARVTENGLAVIRKESPKDHTGGQYIEYRSVPPSCLAAHPQPKQPNP